MSAIDVLLSRLDGVRSSGGSDRWMAKCPAHKDRSPSLAIAYSPDGRILIHCFAECDVSDVLAAVGMDIRDLFPEPLQHRIEPRRLGVSPFDVLRAMRHEMLVLSFIAEDIQSGGRDVELCQRAQQAAGRIRTALALCDG